MKLLELTLQTVIAAMAVVTLADAFTPTTTKMSTMVLKSTSSSDDADAPPATTASSATSFLENLPDVKELSTSPFMKQVQYGTEMTTALHTMSTTTSSTTLDDEDDEVYDKMKESLEAQLSHSDGIRGFMVAYLTGEYQTTDEDGSIDATDMIENETDPQILLETLHGLLLNSDSTKNEELVSLMCMNVVMPVAMISMHKEPALSAASRLTAARGARLLGSMISSSASIQSNVEALLEAATTNSTKDSDDEKLIEYWKIFFVKWGYEDQQKEDIAATMKKLLSSSS